VVRVETQALGKTEVSSPLHHHQEEVTLGQAMQKKLQVDEMKEE
jgi:hypothetical protein